MFNKNLVSLFFSQERLQILQLSRSRDRAVKYATLDLPKGLISNYKVQDKSTLAEILKTTWAKLGIREKSVGIVVPEFSTFTKLLSLPSLELEEIDEAVRWQAHEFLPVDPSIMVMDWKIAERLDSGFKILACAIDKEVLGGYVDSASDAGLFPLVVEIPSISLVRMLEPMAGIRLILYDSHGEVIIIVAKGETVLGSSIVPLDDKEEIVKISKRILEHYGKTDLEKILIGGSLINSDLPQKLEKSFNKSVSFVKPEIKGLPEEGIQEYLIPISLQFKDPIEPASEQTINLLPINMIIKYKKERLKLQIWGLTLTITLFVWISFLTILGTHLYLRDQTVLLKKSNKLVLESLQKRREVSEQVREINEISENILKIKAIYVMPQEILNAIYSAVPPGVSISKYDVDLDKGEIKLSGRASDRLGVVEFKQKLEKNPNFSAINVPISSFELKENSEFNLSFEYPKLKPDKSVKK